MPEKIHALWNTRFLTQIIESMADGVFTLDADGRITSWNPAMERICGYSAAEALGQTCRILSCSRCFGRDCPTDHNTCGLLREGRAEDNECLLQHRDGHSVPVIKNARAVFDDAGKIIGAVETVTDLTELKKARQAADAALQRLEERFRFANIIGKSKGMQDVFDAIRAAAASRATVLIQGESGTGKELVAAAIHYNSDVAAQPLVTVNCSALSETLLESELFGHVRGAFTGAHRDRMGRFEEADGGTIFLDEIGELSPFIQVKLLRVLQEREIERVGDSRRRKIDIRVIAASNKDLRGIVEKGEFREDLYYRLNVIPLHIPPLRERREDMQGLLTHFLKKFGMPLSVAFSSQALEAIKRYHWPGNIRELQNMVERCVILRKSDSIDLADLNLPRPETTCEGSVPEIPAGGISLAAVEKGLIEKALARSRGNRSEAARLLSIPRHVLIYRLEKYGIQPA